MSDREISPDEFHGLKGKAKQWASLGAIGLLSMMCAHLVVFQNPAMHANHLKSVTEIQEKAAIQLKEERTLSKEEAAKSRQHGGEVARELTEGLKENAKAIQSLNETFIRVQERTQENQRTLIELQLKKMEQDKAK